MLILNRKSALTNRGIPNADMPRFRGGEMRKRSTQKLLCFIITYTVYSSKDKSKDLEAGQAILENYKSKWRHIYSFRRHRLLLYIFLLAHNIYL